MASNSTESVQSSSSQPPAKIMSCLPDLDHFRGIADAMVGGRAGRRDRIVDALDLEPGGERRRGGRRHRLGHRERADPLRALVAGDVGRLDDGARRGPARAHDDAGASRSRFRLLEPGIADRLLHGDVVPGRAAAEEAHGAAVDRPRSASSVGAPCTWQRKPSSAYLSAREMPDFASRRLASTSWVLLPIDETMPIPVTTTRLMTCLVRISTRTASATAAVTRRSAACSFVAEQADLEVDGAIDDRRRRPTASRRRCRARACERITRLMSMP